jgi:CO/xanthine dehydrogenase Mo-binding subunit
MSILGTRVLRREDPDLLTGDAHFVDDTQPEHVAHVTHVTSPIAHAAITRVDVEAAKAAPGVLGVFTAADLPFDVQPAAIAEARAAAAN